MLPTLKIELNAVWRGGRWEVINAKGRCIAVVRERLIQATAFQLENPGEWTGDEWTRCMRLQIQRLKQCARNVNQSAWDRKFQSMAQTALKRSRPKGVGSGRDRKQGATWYERMRANVNTIKYERKRAYRTEWDRWAETLHGNIRKRATIRKDRSTEAQGSA